MEPTRFHVLLETLAFAQRHGIVNQLWAHEGVAEALVDSHKFLVDADALMSSEQLPLFGWSLVEKNLFRMPFDHLLIEVPNWNDEAGDGTAFFHASQLIGAAYDQHGAEVSRGPDDVQVLVTWMRLIRDARDRRSKFIGLPAMFWLDMSSTVVTEYDWVRTESKDWTLDAAHALMDIIRHVLLAFVALVNSKSVLVTNRQSPAKLNKARLRRGLPPIYEHTVVDLPARELSSRVDLGGTHASPRLHWRRGHFRRWKEGVIPVSPCLVGSIEDGLIAHLYQCSGGRRTHA